MKYVRLNVCHVLFALLYSLAVVAPFLTQKTIIQASPETIVQVEPLTSYANTSETFTINVAVVDVQNLYGFEVSLFWSPSVLNATAIDVRVGVESYPDGVLHEREQPPPILIMENSLAQEQGRYRLSATSLSPASSFNGSGTIVRITFNVTGARDSLLDLSSLLYDHPPPEGVSEPIDHVTVDGSFEIVPEFPSVATLAVLMAFAASVIVLSKRKKLSPKEKNRQLSRSSQTRLISSRKTY